MTEQTEEQIITMSPLKVSIGGQLKDLPILKAGKASEWKREWGKVVFEYQDKIFKVDTLRAAKASEEDIMKAAFDRLDEILIGAQDKILNLVCSYADKSGGEITGEVILSEAWDTEVKAIWDKIFEEMFTPLATSLPSAITPKTK